MYSFSGLKKDVVSWFRNYVIFFSQRQEVVSVNERNAVGFALPAMTIEGTQWKRMELSDNGTAMPLLRNPLWLVNQGTAPPMWLTLSAGWVASVSLDWDFSLFVSHWSPSLSSLQHLLSPTSTSSPSSLQCLPSLPPPHPSADSHSLLPIERDMILRLPANVEGKKGAWILGRTSCARVSNLWALCSSFVSSLPLSPFVTVGLPRVAASSQNLTL